MVVGERGLARMCVGKVVNLEPEGKIVSDELITLNNRRYNIDSDEVMLLNRAAGGRHRGGRPGKRMRWNVKTLTVPSPL